VFCRHQSQKSLTQIPALDKRPERSQFSLEFVAVNQLAVAENLPARNPTSTQISSHTHYDYLIEALVPTKTEDRDLVF
jgi:hypothetical protein